MSISSLPTLLQVDLDLIVHIAKWGSGCPESQPLILKDEDWYYCHCGLLRLSTAILPAFACNASQRLETSDMGVEPYMLDLHVCAC